MPSEAATRALGGRFSRQREQWVQRPCGKDTSIGSKNR